jgi:hypothetical protein
VCVPFISPEYNESETFANGTNKTHKDYLVHLRSFVIAGQILLYRLVGRVAAPLQEPKCSGPRLGLVQFNRQKPCGQCYRCCFISQSKNKDKTGAGNRVVMQSG